MYIIHIYNKYTSKVFPIWYNKLMENSYMILAQSFIDDQLVMKIKASDIVLALDVIKEENKNKKVLEFSRESSPEEDIYIIKIYEH